MASSLITSDKSGTGSALGPYQRCGSRAQVLGACREVNLRSAWSKRVGEDWRQDVVAMAKAGATVARRMD